MGDLSRAWFALAVIVVGLLVLLRTDIPTMIVVGTAMVLLAALFLPDRNGRRK